MTRFCANLSMMFLDHETLDRLGAARQAGFAGAEFQFPYDLPAEDMAKASKAAGVEIVNFNTSIGDRAAGDVGVACLPGREDEFRRHVAEARAYAEVVGCRRINVLMGIVRADAERSRCLELLARNLDWAAAEMAEAGILLLTEPINHYDRPGYCINTVGEAARLLREIGNANLRLEADIYHMALEEEDVAATLRQNIDMIGHIQFADVPGRHEPGTGALDFTAIFGAVEEAGYTGWLSAEYDPSDRTEHGLEWLATFTRGR